MDRGRMVDHLVEALRQGLKPDAVRDFRTQLQGLSDEALVRCYREAFGGKVDLDNLPEIPPRLSQRVKT